jgi:hypothetical protein
MSFLRGSHGEPTPDDFIGEEKLLLRRLERKKHFAVADGDSLLREEALDLRMQIEEAHAVCHGGAALSDLLAMSSCRRPNSRASRAKACAVFNGVQFFALRVLISASSSTS